MEEKIPRMMTVRQIAETGLLPENTIRVMLRTCQSQNVHYIKNDIEEVIE